MVSPHTDNLYWWVEQWSHWLMKQKPFHSPWSFNLFISKTEWSPLCASFLSSSSGYSTGDVQIVIYGTYSVEWTSVLVSQMIYVTNWMKKKLLVVLFEFRFLLFLSNSFLVVVVGNTMATQLHNSPSRHTSIHSYTRAVLLPYSN